jgi:hypothetical protein
MINGIEHLVVQPAPWMLNSTMISGIVNRGDELVVNMQTGVLSSHKPEIKLRPLLSAALMSRESGGIKIDLQGTLKADLKRLTEVAFDFKTPTLVIYSAMLAPELKNRLVSIPYHFHGSAESWFKAIAAAYKIYS